MVSTTTSVMRGPTAQTISQARSSRSLCSLNPPVGGRRRAEKSRPRPRRGPYSACRSERWGRFRCPISGPFSSIARCVQRQNSCQGAGRPSGQPDRGHGGADHRLSPSGPVTGGSSPRLGLAWGDMSGVGSVATVAGGAVRSRSGLRMASLSGRQLAWMPPS